MDCENYDWGPVDVAQWENVPFIARTLADEEDVRCGRAVYYILGGANEAVTDFALPRLAELREDTGEWTTVIIIQIEARPSQNQKIVGYRYLDGGNGVGTLAQFKLVETD